MKTKLTLLRNFGASALAAASLLISISHGHAANLTWDADATANTSYGGAGTWNANTTANWTSADSEVMWTDTSASLDTAVFADTAGAVTLSGSLSALGLQFLPAAGGYTLSGGTVLTLGSGGIDASGQSSGVTTISSPLGLAAGQSWNVGPGATLSVGGVISGANALEKTGAGTLTLGGANTFSGGLTITGGAVTSTVVGGFGAGAVAIGASGTANINTTANVNIANAFSGNGVLNVNPGATAPALTSGSSLNNFTGTINVNTTGGGKFVMNGVGSNIGSGATVNIAAGATFYIPVNTTINGVTFNVAGAGNTENLGAIRLENGLTIGSSSSIVASGNIQLGQNQPTACTINAPISESGGSRSVEKLGNGGLILGGNNSYTGSTILTGGTLSVSSDSAGAYNLGGSAGNGNNGITFNGGVLQITGTTMTSFGNHTPTFTAAKNVTIDISNAANNFTISQNLNQTTGALVKIGSGTLTLSGINNYTGGTRANAGTTVLAGSQTAGYFLSINNVGAQNAVLKVASGAGTLAHTADLNEAEAANARGAVYQEGGTLSFGNGLKIGSGATSYAYYKLSSGTLTNTGGDMSVGLGSGATGVMDVTGGSATTGSWIVLGRNGAGNGSLNVTGGSITSNSNNIALNWANTAGSISILNVGGGAGAASVTGVSSASNYFDVSQSNTVGTTGVANLLTNGTLTVAKVQSGNGGSTALFNFNGGTLKATAANAGVNFMNSANLDAVTVYGNGGNIDNNGTNITIGRPLGAASGNGVSSVAVSDGGSGYIGAPLVKFSGGTGNTATGYAVMADDGSGNGTYKVASIVITSPGTYSVDPTTVTLSGGGASTAATIGAITTGVNNTSGGMTFNGAGTTTLSAANTYSGQTLIGAGTLALGHVAALQNSTLNYNNQGGTLSFGALTSSTFGGLSGAQNLTLSNNSSAAVALTVGNNNSSTTYSGALSGNGSLAKNGTGTLTLTGANTYAGATTISSGTLKLGDGASLNGSVTGNITNNAALVFANPNAQTYGGNIGGAGSVAVTGNGTLTLTGVNNYTGGTTIGAGILQLGDGSTVNGVIAGNVSNGGTIAFANPTAQSYTGIISGIGGLNKSGDGVLTLSANNSYAGPTTVNAGTLVFSGNQSITGDIAAANGANLKVVLGSTGAPTLTPASLTLSSGAFSGLFTIDFNSLSNPTTAPISMSGALTLNGDIGLAAANPGNLTNGTFTLFSAGSISGAFVNPSIQFGARSTGNIGYTSTAVTMDVITDAITWSGANGGVWTTTATNDNSDGNWASVAGKSITSFWADDIVKFGDTYDTTNSGGGLTSLTSPQTVTLNESVSPASVEFNNSAVDYTVEGTGAISGITGLVKNGTGAVTIATANNYSGGTTLNSGTLNINNASAIGTGALTIAGGTLDNTSGAAITLSTNNAQNWNGSFGFTGTHDLDLGTGAVTLGTTPTVTVNGGTLTVGGAMGGNFGLTKAGSGRLVLGSANTYTGATTLNAGTLSINNASAIGTGALTLNGGTLDNTSGAAITLSTNNAQNWNGSFGFTGTKDLNLGTGAVTLGASPTVTVDAGTLTVGGAIGGNFGLTKAGNGTLLLTGSSAYNGGTTINAGTLQFSNGSALGTGTVTANGGTLRYNYVSGNGAFANNLVVNGATTLDVTSGNWNFNGNISGSGAINRGFGANLTLYLNGDDSGYTGTFTSPNYTNAVVRFGSPSAGSAGASWVFNNATAGRTTLSWTGTGTISFGSLTGGGELRADVSGAKTISAGALGYTDSFTGSIVNGLGVVALTKVGSGDMTLTGNNSYTGPTTVNNGILTVNGVNSGTGLVTVASGATLAGSGTIAGATVVSGSLTGTLTLNSDATINSGAFGAAAAFNGNIVNNGTITSALTVASGKTLSGNGTFGNNLTVNGSLVTGSTATPVISGSLGFGGSAQLSIALGKTTAGATPVAGTDYGRLTVGGDVSLGGTLALTIGTGVQAGDVFYLIVNDGSNAIATAFTGVTVNGSAMTLDGNNGFTFNGQQYGLTYSADSGISSLSGGNDVALFAAVPEPTTWAMIVGGLGMLVSFQRSRRRN
jgi:autotransporter-associated beta strand protein